MEVRATWLKGFNTENWGADCKAKISLRKRFGREPAEEEVKAAVAKEALLRTAAKAATGSKKAPLWFPDVSTEDIDKALSSGDEASLLLFSD